MSEALVVSNVLLWIAVLALGAVVAALTRQIGLLHERLAPVGALSSNQGPAIGETVAEMTFTDLSGDSVRLGGTQSDGRTLLFFLSPSCPICKSLLPTLRRVVAAEAPNLKLVLASDGPIEEHRRFRTETGLDDLPYVLSTELGLRFGVARLPTAILIDADGILRANAMVNSREHLESLFVAEELGVASVQEFVERERPAIGWTS